MQCAGYPSIREALLWATLTKAVCLWGVARRAFPQWRQWLVVLLMVPVVGCATMTKPETHHILAAEFAKQYIGLHEQYVNLEQRLPESKVEDLQELAPLMDRTKHLLIDYTEMVAQGETDTEEVRDSRKVLQELLAYLTEQIATIALSHLEDEDGT